MKNVKGLLFVMFMHGFFFHTALAQDGKTTLVPLPSVDDFTRGSDGWSFGLGLSVEYESVYEGSDEFGFEVDPAGAAQWRSGGDIFFRAGEVLGWRGLHSNRWLLEAPRPSMRGVNKLIPMTVVWMVSVMEIRVLKSCCMYVVLSMPVGVIGWMVEF